MPLDPFYQYLETVVSPERQRTIIDAIETLDKLGSTDHHYHLNEILESPEDETSVVLQQIDSLLVVAFHDFLLKFGVQVESTTPLDMLTSIMKGLLCLDDWSDPVQIQQMCEVQDSSEGILANLLELVGDHSHAEYFLHLNSVSQSLIDRIDDINQTCFPEGMPDDDVQQHAKERIERLLKVAQPSILSQAIADLLLFGGSFHGLIEPYEEAIAKLDSKEAIPELVGFACASELKDDELQGAIEKETQGWWEGASFTQVIAQVKALLKEVLS